MGRAARKEIAGSARGNREGARLDQPLAASLPGPVYLLEERVRAAPGSRRRTGTREASRQWLEGGYHEEIQEIEGIGEEDLDQRERLGVEEVPLQALYPLMEYNREFSLGPYSRDSALLESIRQNGVVQPLHVLYNPETGQAFVNEGNHRLGLARLAGLETVPVHVVPTVEDYSTRAGAEVPIRPSSSECPGCAPDSPEGPFSPSDIGLAAEDQHRARNRELYRREQAESPEQSVDKERIKQAREIIARNPEGALRDLQKAGLVESRALRDENGKKITSPCGSSECMTQGHFLPDGSGVAETYCSWRGGRAPGNSCGKTVAL